MRCRSGSAQLVLTTTYRLGVHRRLRHVAPPASISSFQANVAFPASPTTTITWTVLASGGVGALVQVLRFNPSSGSIVMRDWSLSNQATWTPGAGNTGEHAVQVWARSVGRTRLRGLERYGTFSIAAPE